MKDSRKSSQYKTIKYCSKPARITNHYEDNGRHYFDIVYTEPNGSSTKVIGVRTDCEVITFIGC
jgi:phosphoribosylformylglycinamidine (FGAM) synthase-like amidotransferase family enzyme